MVAVVGSFGKTTTVLATRRVLELPLKTFRQGNTRTPAALNLLALSRRAECAVLEAAIDGPGQMRYFSAFLKPDVAVVTSVGSEHNRSLGTLERTAHEKGKMVEGLSADGLAILNGDDPRVAAMASRTRARVIRFGFDPANDVRAAEWGLEWPRGMRFRLQWRHGSQPVHVRLLGRHMVYPLLAAAAVALEEGMDPARVVARLEQTPPVKGRMETSLIGNGTYLLRDDFKSTLETIETAFDTLAEIPVAKKTIVLGEVSEPVGSQGPIYRGLGKKMGGIADRVIIVASRRSFERYSRGLREAGLPKEAIHHAGYSVIKAASLVRESWEPGEVVLVKGRDRQRMIRVSLALQGREVRCEIPDCNAKLTPCERCQMLERGWGGLPAAV